MENEKKINIMFSVGQAPSPVLPQSVQKAQARAPELPYYEYVQAFKSTHRNLPHWQEPGRVYFITFRTYKNLQLDEQSKQIIFNNIIHYSKIKYKLYSFVIMNDHVHIILQPNEIEPGKYINLSEIMHSIKSFTAKKIIKHLQYEWTETTVLPEKIFQSESYDRIIRTEDELKEKMNYIHNNPIKKGLCEDGYNYKWFYVLGKE